MSRQLSGLAAEALLRTVAALLLFFAGVCGASSDTLAARLRGRPELSVATKLLQSLDVVWRQLGDPSANLTLFVADNAGVERAKSSGAWRVEASKDQSGVSSLALGLYAVLPGTYSNQTALVEARTINTALGVLLRRDYPLAFECLPDGTLAVQRPWDWQGENGRSIVIAQQQTVNGQLYQLDQLLIPSGYTEDPMWNLYGTTNTSMAEATDCGNTNVITVASRLPGRYLRQATWGLYGLKPMLSAPTLSITIFLTTDESLRTIMKQENLTDVDMMKYKQADMDPILYTMLSGAYCPEELIQAGSMETMFGHFRTPGFPLRFSLHPETGQLVVTGRTGPGGVVTGIELACNTIIYLLDGFVMPFAPGNISNEVKSTVVPGSPPMLKEQLFRGSNNEPPAGVDLSSIVPSYLPSGLPRHLSCLPPITRRNATLTTLYQYIEGGGPATPTATEAAGGTSAGAGGGSNAGMITGAVVGCVAAAAAALAAGLLVYRCRVRRQTTAGESRNGVDSLKSMPADLISIGVDSEGPGSPGGTAGSTGAAGSLPLWPGGGPGASLVSVGDLASAGRLLRLPSRQCPSLLWTPESSAELSGGSKQPAEQRSTGALLQLSAGDRSSQGGEGPLGGPPGQPTGLARISLPAAQALPPSPFVAALPAALQDSGGSQGPSPWGLLCLPEVPSKLATRPSRPPSAQPSYGLDRLDLGKLSSRKSFSTAELESLPPALSNDTADTEATAEADKLLSLYAHSTAAHSVLSGEVASSAVGTSGGGAGSGGGMSPKLSDMSGSSFLDNGWGAVFSEYAGALASGDAQARARATMRHTSSLQLAGSASISSLGIDSVGSLGSGSRGCGSASVGPAVAGWEPSKPTGGDWELDPKEIEICTHDDGALVELGMGAFGKVYQGLRNGVTPVAVKILHRDAQRDAMTNLQNEVAILKACQDPSIVQFYGACLRSEWLMLVTEYMPGRDLARSIRLPQFRWYAWGRRCALDIARGLVFLHARGVVHFDLKSSNILLAADGTAKIADMGLSKVLSHTYLSHTAAMGTFAWASPEQILGLRCTNKTDIVSLGMLLWELVTGEVPLRGHLHPLQAPDDCPQAVVDLVESCLELNPKLRPTAQAAYDLLLIVQ